MLNIGDQAPDFTTTDADGNSYQLSQLKGKYVVLYFYPKDMTIGCTKEACEFRDSYQNFGAVNTVVLAVSNNPAEDHVKFRDQHQLPFPLLMDEDKRIVNLYQVYGEKSFLGKKYMGINRVTFLIAPDGKIAFIWPKVNPIGHAEQVLAKVKELQSTKG